MKRLPTGDAWLHEPKLDGWRIQAVKIGTDIALYSRNGRDLRGRVPGIAESVRKLRCRSVILDCELILVADDGIDFYGLMNKGRPTNAALVALDIIELNGANLRLCR